VSQTERNPRKKEGLRAGIGFSTGEKILTFIFKMSFPATKDQSSINMYTPHKAFITELYGKI
jgi:hypothetical protein